MAIAAPARRRRQSGTPRNLAATIAIASHAADTTVSVSGASGMQDEPGEPGAHDDHRLGQHEHRDQGGDRPPRGQQRRDQRRRGQRASGRDEEHQHPSVPSRMVSLSSARGRHDDHDRPALTRPAGRPSPEPRRREDSSHAIPRRHRARRRRSCCRIGPYAVGSA